MSRLILRQHGIEMSICIALHPALRIVTMLGHWKTKYCDLSPSLPHPMLSGEQGASCIAYKSPRPAIALHIRLA